MKQTKPATARIARSSLLISVFARPQTSETMHEEAMWVAFGVVFSVGALEAIATITWWPWFYRNAPPLWRI
jgi:hypothetical protein